MKKYIQLIRENFNQCLFLGFVSWALCIHPIMSLSAHTRNSFLLYGLFSLLNGILCWGIVRIGRFLFKRFFQNKHRLFYVNDSIEIIAFFAGIFCLFTSFRPFAFILSGIIALLTLLKIESFTRKMIAFLPPHRYITHREIFVFFGFFIDLIMFFTIFNLTLGIIDHPVILASENILNEKIVALQSDNLFNALYFTVITLTTVGFGDFIPVSRLGKMVVVLECLTSYIMFGLMIGLISRGVQPVKSIHRTARQSALSMRSRQ